MRFLYCLAIVGVVFIVPGEAWAQVRRTPAVETGFRAKIDEDSARSVVLARVPNGKVAAVQLKVEQGTLVYFYDVAVPGKAGLQELQVSAVDGQVISVQQLGGGPPH